MIYWLALLAAGCCEMIGVIGIARVNKSPTILSYFILTGGFALSLGLLSIAMKGIDMSVAYAVWTGIGAAGSTLSGMFVFGEPKRKARIGFIFLIVASVIGLKLVS
jgi:paired small multidrug resistance pump